MSDITEIQPFFEVGSQVRMNARSRKVMKNVLGEPDLADATGVVLEITMNGNGEPLYLLLLSYGESRKVAQNHLEAVV